MADNYIERQYEQYEARKAAWERSRKYGKKKTAPAQPQPKKPAENTASPSGKGTTNGSTPMKMHHIAIWTFRLEELREFYVRYFHGNSNEKYVNPKKGFESYFISFEGGPALELMSRTDVQNVPIEENRRGLTHLAFSFESPEAVLSFTEQLRAAGYAIAGEPRTSGDGYFESVILDPDGNRIECVYKE